MITSISEEHAVSFFRFEVSQIVLKVDCLGEVGGAWRSGQLDSGMGKRRWDPGQANGNCNP
jgi:hypothetical protein